MIVGIVMAILVLVLLALFGFGYWSKKNERFCFEKKGIARPGRPQERQQEMDPNMMEPLNDEPNDRPIIRTNRPNTSSV